MNFRTEIKAAYSGWHIDHGTRGLALGSCFADNVSRKLMRYKYPLCANPFGVLFNPSSVASALEMLHHRQIPQKDSLVRCYGKSSLWHSFDFHGSFSGTDGDAVLKGMRDAVRSGAEALRVAEYVILTFGTAWVYERNGNVVANCHKFPASEFSRRRLTVAEIVEQYDGLFDTALKGKKVILTVSPVRHLKDGLPENSLSKAILRLAVEELCDRHPQAVYFPAFEILTDDLRDYRFYERDMCHPSAVAIDYVWEKFRDAFVDPHEADLDAALEKIALAREHRPTGTSPETHSRFCEGMLQTVRKLQEENPCIDLSGEESYFENYIFVPPIDKP